MTSPLFAHAMASLSTCRCARSSRRTIITNLCLAAAQVVHD
jgi:hypothetical protein